MCYQVLLLERHAQQVQAVFGVGKVLQRLLVAKKVRETQEP